MNKPIFYIPFSMFVFLCIVQIALSVPSFNLHIHFLRLLMLSVFLAFSTGAVIYYLYKSRLDFENMYTLVGTSILFSFAIYLASITLLNRKYATNHCYTASYKVASYEGRYTSGLGLDKKEKIKANQWILTIVKDGTNERFVLEKDISTNNQVTKTMNLQFCKGILGTEILTLEQIPN